MFKKAIAALAGFTKEVIDLLCIMVLVDAIFGSNE